MSAEQLQCDPWPSPALAEAVRRGPEALLEALLAHMVAAGLPATFSAPEGEGGGVPITFGDRTVGRLDCPGAAPARLAALAATLGAWLTLAEEHRDLRVAAFTDELTGAGSRRDFERFTAAAIELARVQQRPLPLMAFDIDDFKRYNDTYGHAAGDDVLRETVALLRAVIRRGDRVFRIGGDEFVVVFADPTSPREPNSRPVESVGQIIERFKRGVRELRLPHLGEEAPGSITVSAGLAIFPDDAASAGDLLRIADERALTSKRRGKDVVTFGGREMEGGEGDPGIRNQDSGRVPSDS